MLFEEKVKLFDGQDVTEFLESYEEQTLIKVDDAFLAKLLDKSFIKEEYDGC